MVRSSIFILLLTLLSATITACGGGTGISQVTALPTHTATIDAPASPSATEPQAPPPTAEPTTEPTSRLEATATAVASATRSTERSTGGNTFALLTATPAENLLAPGEARAIALATDVGMVPVIDKPLTFDTDIVPVLFSDFYSGYNIRTGLQFSDKLKSLDGQRVVIEGYVAPPLKPKLDFFVLTRIQLAFCPFCSTDVEWPDDIALVYLNAPEIITSEFPVRITGQLEIGTSVDAETGMVSLVRIYAENWETIN